MHEADIMYPAVHGEYETIAKINEGFSIARFGDGETGVMTGTGYTRNVQCNELSAELQHVMNTPSEHCLIGVPTMDKRGDKYKNWCRHIERYSKLYPPIREYYSSFISRPDCGKWLRTVEYAKAVRSIWTGKSVAFIGSEPGRNKLAKVIEETSDIVFIECPWRDAYDEIDNLERKALEAGKDIVILSAGVTATCLAYRLAPKVQAVDLGSIGGFLATMLHGHELTPEMAENTSKI